MGGGNPSLPQSVDAYNPATDSWSTVSQMLTSREGAGVAALNGKIYVAGGHVSGGAASAVFEVYDPVTNSWIGLPAMPTARSSFAFVAAGGKLYAIGGGTEAGGASQSPTAVVESYDPIAQSWTARATLSAPRSGIVAGALNNEAMIVVAGNSTGGPSTELYDVAGNTWTAGPAMLTPTGGTAAAVVNNALYVFGGSTNGGLTLTHLFRPASGQQSSGWAALAAMPTARGQLAAAAVGDVVYAIGGQANAQAVATVEAFSAPLPSNFFVSSGGSGGGGGSSVPTVSWQSTNPSIAGINSFGFATANALGQTTIVATAGGMTCQPSGCATLTVADTTPPNLFVPGQPFIAKATSAAGATVNFGGAVSAFDSVDGQVTPSCTPSTGSNFPIGSTSVSCMATDLHGNSSAPKTFTVQVNDTLTIHLPANIVADATSPAGAAVPFSVSATYFLGGTEPVQCFIIAGFVNGDPQIGPPVASGATFPVGATTVGCLANNPSGGHEGGFFTITVLSAQQILANLVAQAGALNQNNSQLQNAVQSFNNGSVGAACNQLGAYINSLQGKAGKSVPAGDAAALIQSAAHARAAMGC